MWVLLRWYEEPEEGRDVPLTGRAEPFLVITGPFGSETQARAYMNDLPEEKDLLDALIYYMNPPMDSGDTSRDRVRAELHAAVERACREG